MGKYVEYNAVSSMNINNYLSEGWEVIHATEERNGLGDMSVVYHIGYPAEKRIEELTNLLKTYEELGFKDELFREYATSIGEEGIVEKLTTNGGAFTYSKTAAFMSNYDKLVHNRDTSYYQKSEMF